MYYSLYYWCEGLAGFTIFFVSVVKLRKNQKDFKKNCKICKIVLQYNGVKYTQKEKKDVRKKWGI